MSTKSRIYKVTSADKIALVRAPNVASARNHAARQYFEVKVASQDDLVALAKQVEVESAVAKDDAP